MPVMMPKVPVSAVLLMFLSVVCFAQPKKEMPKDFYVYKDAGSHGPDIARYCPAGWMGSYKSLSFNQAWNVNPYSGKTCIRIVYDISKDQEALWAGIYWANPCSNWGDKKGGYDLTGYKKLTFWAKGEGRIEKIGMGGITGQTEDGDTAEENIQPLELTSEWKQYTVDLSKADLRHIIGGFVFAASADFNQKNVVLFLDDIKYTR